MTKGRTTLIVTLPPQWLGGVQSKACFLAGHLTRLGHKITMAYYAGRSLRPDLNQGISGTLMGRRSSVDRFLGEDGYEHVVVGCRIPEMEYTYTAPSDAWASVISEFDRIVAVGGTPMIANPVVAANKSALIWCADDLDGDRTWRHDGMPWPRRQFDSAWVRPRLKAQEADILRSSCVFGAVSNYSMQRLRDHDAALDERLFRLPIPVDVEYFSPPQDRGLSGRMGFAGRVADPRKNADLLFDVFRRLRDRGIVRRLDVVGPPDDRVAARVTAMGLQDDIHFLGVLDRDGLRAFYRSIDVLAMTSHREGLGIVGLEAMACGTPVVSTRSGGPEDFVVDGETGYLSDFSVDGFADRVRQTVEDRAKFLELSVACRDKVCKEFSEPAFAREFDGLWRRQWQEDYRAGG